MYVARSSFGVLMLSGSAVQSCMIWGEQRSIHHLAIYSDLEDELGLT